MRKLVSRAFSIICCLCIAYYAYIIVSIGIFNENEHESVFVWIVHAIVFGIFLWIPMMIYNIYLISTENITPNDKICELLTSITMLLYFTSYVICVILH